MMAHRSGRREFSSAVRDAAFSQADTGMIWAFLRKLMNGVAALFRSGNGVRSLVVIGIIAIAWIALVASKLWFHW
jgi:hypothetical protein